MRNTPKPRCTDMDIDRDEIFEGFEELAKEESMRLAREWHSTADQLLIDRGDNLGFEVFPIVQGSVPPQWDDERGAVVFKYPHESAIYMEMGADPHTIRAKNADYLAFEWEEMEGVEFGNTGMTFDEVFSDTFPTVFFKEVEHPGIPALRFVRDGWRRTSQ